MLTGPDGKLLIDAGISVSRPQITRALMRLGADPSPISSIRTGTSITPTATHGCTRPAPGSSRRKTPANIFPKCSVSRTGTTISCRWPQAAFRARCFAKEHSLKLNGASIGLKHYGPAHTDSDISVTFAEANVVHVGDTFWNGIYPFIDYSTGGSIDGTIAACEANLAATTDDTIIIPGHGKPVSNKAELKEFRDMLVAIRDNVAKLKKQGRSRDETVAAKPTAAFDAKFGQFVIDPGFFTRLVYEGV